MATSVTSQTTQQFWALYGLQHTLDLTAFQKSPAGRSIEKMIQDVIAALVSQQNLTQVRQQTLHRRLLHRLLSILSDVAEERGEKVKALHRAIQEYIDKGQQLLKLLPSDSSTTAALEAKLAFYDDMIRSLELTLAGKNKELENIEQAIQTLNIELSMMDVRHRQDEACLSEFDFEKIQQLPGFLHTTLEGIESEMSSYAKIISALLENGQETEAQTHTELAHRLHLKCEMVHMMELSQKQNRHLFDRDAKRVFSFEQADFFVPHDKILSLVGGQYYIHPQDKPFNTLTPKEKLDAKEAYQQSMKSIMGVPMQLKLQQTHERSFHTEKMAELTAKQDALKQDILLIKNCLAKVHEARVALQQRLTHIIGKTPEPSPLSEQRPHTPQARQKDARLAGIANQPLRDMTKPVTPTQQMALLKARATMPITTPTPSPFAIKPKGF